MRRKNDIKGMSLLELVIVLAIVAILSAYAIPAYQSYIRRGHRSAVCTALYRAAQAVEQMLAERSATGERMKLPSSEPVSAGYKSSLSSAPAGPESKQWTLHD